MWPINCTAKEAFRGQWGGPGDPNPSKMFILIFNINFYRVNAGNFVIFCTAAELPKVVELNFLSPDGSRNLACVIVAARQLLVTPWVPNITKLPTTLYPVYYILGFTQRSYL